MFSDVEAATLLDGRVAPDERRPVTKHDFGCQLCKPPLHADSDGQEVVYEYRVTNICVERRAWIDSAAGEPNPTAVFHNGPEKAHRLPSWCTDLCWYAERSVAKLGLKIPVPA